MWLVSPCTYMAGSLLVRTHWLKALASLLAGASMNSHPRLLAGRGLARLVSFKERWDEGSPTPSSKP